jgi:chromosome segregation ATPase
MSEIAAFQAKNQKIESDLMSLKINYDNLVEESQAAYKTIESLQTQLAERVDIKREPDDNAAASFHRNFLENKVDSLEFEINQLEQKTLDDKITIEKQKEELQALEKSEKKQNQISNKLNKEMSEVIAKSKKEKKLIIKEHKSAIKHWKKELSEETKLKIKIEERLNKPVDNPAEVSTVLTNDTTEHPEETLCTICAAPIVNYVQKYFHGEAFSPACDKFG